MAKNYMKAPRGTQDIIGAESLRWQRLEQTLRETSALFGFTEIRTPTFEQMQLFVRTVGDATDVVQKEMYEVQAAKGNELYALKPEGTAGVIRSVIEHGILKGSLPQKMFYLTPCFRHERPQAGRLREFHQYGVEMFGTSAPVSDVEVIALVQQLFDQLGLQNIALGINSIGCPTCRKGYYGILREFYQIQHQNLCNTCHQRLDKNPMRLLDCKTLSCAKIAKQAPVMLDFLCDDCKTHFERVKKHLTAGKISFTINPKIVRGLDYYTKTVFEFTATDLGAQSAVCGGGRYDGLIEQMGGDALPGIGFAIGLERLLMIMEAQQLDTPQAQSCRLFVASMGECALEKATAMVRALREQGVWAELDLMERTLKAQMKYANKIGAMFAMVLGENELNSNQAQLKQMATGEEITVQLDQPVEALLQAMNQCNTDSEA